MRFISPVTPEACRVVLGKPVCAVLHDGSRVYGYVHDAAADRLLLSAGPRQKPAPPETLPAGRSGCGQAVFPTPRHGCPDGWIALDPARIAFLVPLPFLLV